MTRIRIKWTRITLLILLYGTRVFSDITKMTDEAKMRKTISPYDIIDVDNSVVGRLNDK